MYEMKPMAESLASQGRYGDSMLVHMNPVEVAGLRAAAQRMGGDLTTNPQTGQPEAFLPFLLGMGLQGLGMSALGAGIATGIGTAAITGDLGQGALAGLGAFGGAGMGEGLSAAGAAGTAGTAGAAGTAGTAGAAGATTGAESLLNTTATPSSFSLPGATSVTTTGPQAMSFADPGMVNLQNFAAPGPATGDLLSMAGRPPSDLAGISFSGPQSFANPAVTAPGAGFSLPSGGANAFNFGPDGLMPPGAGEIPVSQAFDSTSMLPVSQQPLPYGQAGIPGLDPSVTGTSLSTPTGSSMTGLKNVLSTGDTGAAAREAFMKGVGGEMGMLKYGAAGLAPYAFEQPTLEGMERQRSLIRPFDYDPYTREFTERTPYTAPGPEYARGGMVQRMAQGGLTGYKEGNILRGQGDGMSDEIEASIGGEQDVLLSDGEYVIPADAVAMLGNGSTDAGANRLDEMIARLRMKKYGRDKQPPEMKAESVMPT